MTASADAPHPLIWRLQNALADASAVLHEPADLEAYERGARYGVGKALCVVRPGTLEELRAVVRLCVEQRVQLVPQGANTGLVAGASPDESGAQVVLSTQRLKGPMTIDPVGQTLRTSAGARLSEINAQAETVGLHFPIDLGADPSIGGMVATNTGGSRLLRYGDVRQNVLGLQVVLMDSEATLIDLNQALRKNNTGVDLKQLFIGSQGTMGCVTEVTLRLWPLPAQRATALVGLAEPADALRLFQAVGHRFADFCTAFEGMSAHAMSAALTHVPSLSHPFPRELPPYAVLLELSSCLPASEDFNLEDRLVDFLYEQDELSMVDTVIGRGQDLWAIRHALSEGLRSSGHVIALDVSMPLAHVFQFRAQAMAWLEEHYPAVTVCDFGHIGDGGLHFNMSWPWLAGEPTPAQMRDIRTTMYDLVVKRYAGSFSAEHGIGPYNQDFYDRYTSVFQRGLIGAIKNTLDPLSLLGRARLGLGQETPPRSQSVTRPPNDA